MQTVAGARSLILNELDTLQPSTLFAHFSNPLSVFECCDSLLESGNYPFQGAGHQRC